MKPRKPATRIMASSRETNPSQATAAKITEAPSMSGTSRRVSPFSTITGRSTAARARISPRLATFDPMTLPITRPVLPLTAPTIDTNSSGAEVPKATTVSPTMTGGTPKMRAMRLPPRISTQAPPTSRAMPRAKSADWIR